ncbi:PAS domain-containing protein, partial [Petrachloros mirabilis]
MRKLRLDQVLLDIPLWHFVWIAGALSTLLSLIMSQLIHGHLTWDYPVTASLISLVVASLVITLIQRLRNQLVDREVRLRAVLDHSPAMIFLKDLDGRYMEANQQFLETFHFTRQDVIGKTDVELFPAAQANAFRAKDFRVMESRRPVEFEEVAQHDDGPHTSIVLRYPVYTSAGILYATGGMATDITERKKMECALREARRTLQILLDDREQLAQALHDNIIQMLYATGLMLEVGQGEVNSNPERVEDRIRAAIAQLRT